MPKFIPLTIAAAFAVALGSALIFIAIAPQRHCSGSVTAGGSAAIGGPFTLVNHMGETVTQKDVITGPTLVYFGFTYCPDVCPLDTARNSEVIDTLTQKGFDVTPVFISIDPERDTPAVLADFIEVLHPKMIGLTGTAKQIDSVSKAYKTYYRKNGDGDDYLMDHSTLSYLMGPDGLWEFFHRDVPADQMAKTIRCYIEQA